MKNVFIDPITKSPLSLDSEGNLIRADDRGSVYYRSYDGCFDFVGQQQKVTKTREIYDHEYSSSGQAGLTLAELAGQWKDTTIPWRKTMLESMGDLSGKNILLLGNGASYKEIYFLPLGAHVVYTDLSLEAVRRAQYTFRRSELGEKYRGNIEFHAVDAMHLPFCDETFDIIYGAKFVGFVPDKRVFFSEARRCLKVNGICRFADDAVAPLWDYAKRKFVRPVRKMLYRSPTSLDSLRSQGNGGFTDEEIRQFKDEFGFRNQLVIREYFLLRIAQLCLGKVSNWNPKTLSQARGLFLAMKWVDDAFAGTSLFKNNRLALTWGFDK